jgi:hypothetical protein
MALEVGIHGLLAFLALMGYLLARNVRALRVVSRDPEKRRALTYCILPILGFLFGGFVEPIYHNSNKIGQLFWVFCGVSFAASAHVLSRVREQVPAGPVASPWTPRERPVGHG